ncbi:hypothetical protein NFHSH190041_33110 [Shewanella sp. NFH-SH190041]|uniref:lysozyme inhibitor LprI family protein n=1 Tax=Shewanella sp. NFH-SH190041 TaxID=2950245 RepID=UPI0021C3BC6C|nr:lysozyme inhibitor LprI family protein [Shewanella sp. NFH-SH190041]BDM65859.1 hypothetical protein NFHSH190041_33110 [Shewanella sp. NFH-SH190041]
MNKWLTLCLALCCSGAMAEEKNCSSDQSLEYIASCYDNLVNRYDQQLNQAYEALKSHVSTMRYDAEIKNEYWTTMAQAQRSWLKMRDNQCLAQGYFSTNDNSSGDIEIDKCMIKTIKQRITFFRQEIAYLRALPLG